MRHKLYILVIAVLSSTLISCNSSDKNSKAEFGSTLGTQAYTFREFSFFEAVDKTKELGLHYIEAYPGQEIGGGIDGVMGFDMNNETRTKIKDHLKKQDVEWKAFGVIIPESREEWDSLFAFAQEMGISNIVSEPDFDDLSYISDLTDEYEVNLAIHNHPQPSPYWNPDTLVSKIEGLSNRVGACADLGHYVRSGLDPVESLKKLEGRIIETHIKDISEESEDARDTVWGTGVVGLPELLKEFKDQGFDGLFSIEYEADPEDNMDQIKESIEFFEEEKTKLN